MNSPLYVRNARQLALKVLAETKEDPARIDRMFLRLAGRPPETREHEVLTGMMSDLSANKDALAAAAGSGFSTATDLADWCVRVLGMPFRDAHHVTGSLVALAEDKGCDLPDLTLEDMQSVHSDITNDVFTVLTVENSVASRISYGGTAPTQVLAQIARWKEILE